MDKDPCRLACFRNLFNKIWFRKGLHTSKSTFRLKFPYFLHTLLSTRSNSLAKSFANRYDSRNSPSSSSSSSANSSKLRFSSRFCSASCTAFCRASSNWSFGSGGFSGRIPCFLRASFLQLDVNATNRKDGTILCLHLDPSSTNLAYKVQKRNVKI